MTVVVLEPNKAPEVRELPDLSLKQLQSIVGGYIELAINHLPARVVVYCNEEGHALNLPLNMLRPTDRWPLVGTLVAVKVSDDGKDVPMTRDESIWALGLFCGWLAESREHGMEVPSHRFEVEIPGGAKVEIEE